MIQPNQVCFNSLNFIIIARNFYRTAVEQDIKLGMDSYYFEYSDQSNSGYGLCGKVILRQNEIVFSAKHKCMDDITSITVSYDENIIEDVNEYRKMLSNIFGDILIIEQVANKQMKP